MSAAVVYWLLANPQAPRVTTTSNPALIIAINPGTTTTRCAAYALGDSGVSAVAEETLEHADSELARFDGIPAQLDYRLERVAAFAGRALAQTPGAAVVACAGRGGMLTPVPPGTIRVNEALVEFALHTPVYQHASNLGAPLAHALASRYRCPAFVADPVSVDQMTDVARITGSPDFKRFSFVHALNIRATARKAASALDAHVDSLRLVIAHLGAVVDFVAGSIRRAPNWASRLGL